jgi:hypothetical protein
MIYVMMYFIDEIVGILVDICSGINKIDIDG